MRCERHSWDTSDAEWCWRCEELTLEELIDIWHFVVQASLELKLTPNDILDEYKRTNKS